MNSLDQTLYPNAATRSLAGIAVPDTPLVARAIEYAREHSEPYLFNHVMRSWLFSVAIAQLRNAPHDTEVLAVATLLHDLGLEKAFDGPLRFEVEGANAARAFARSEGMSERRAQLIWDGLRSTRRRPSPFTKRPRSLCAQPASVSIGVDGATSC